MAKSQYYQNLHGSAYYYNANLWLSKTEPKETVYDNIMNGNNKFWNTKSFWPTKKSTSVRECKSAKHDESIVIIGPSMFYFYSTKYSTWNEVFDSRDTPFIIKGIASALRLRIQNFEDLSQNVFCMCYSGRPYQPGNLQVKKISIQPGIGTLESPLNDCPNPEAPLSMNDAREQL
jgi:hypothetical protein